MIARVLAPVPATPPAPVVGHSVRGREIRLVERDGRRPGRTVLVVGCIHGNECAGTAVTRRLVHGPPPDEGRLLVIGALTPDAHGGGLRVNARGVDLNRNFPSQWRRNGRRGDPEYGGPRPLSEPE